MPSEASLANLRPAWQPGQSGNYANGRGRVRGYARVLSAARNASPEAMQKAIECMRDDSASWSERLKAIAMILDRAWGAPDQKLQLDGVDGANIMIVTGVPKHDDAVSDETTIVAGETTFTITIPASAVEDTTP